MVDSRLIVKKVLDVVIDCDCIWESDYWGEVTYNYLAQCPVCNKENVELEEYGCLQTYFTGKREFCTCSNCKSRFKLVSDEWYHPNFPESIGDETKVILYKY